MSLSTPTAKLLISLSAPPFPNAVPVHANPSTLHVSTCNDFNASHSQSPFFHHKNWRPGMEHQVLLSPPFGRRLLQMLLHADLLILSHQRPPNYRPTLRKEKNPNLEPRYSTHALVAGMHVP
ncbi:hypothetical protein Vretimale_12448 [Volvox reticuliferus]|uniref:Uncharacterized protein n=1 Tax=Volvox reticuliferus TaxID=1737510 RepID=A0A8J4GJS4_9CHLO|nr:hypothetical protein Vretimale_12448 [Volvox reticuliferus]